MAAEEMLRIQVEMEMEMEMEVKATISHFSRNQPTQPIQLMPPKAADFLLCLDMALGCRSLVLFHRYFHNGRTLESIPI